MEGIKVFVRVRPLTVDGDESFCHDDEHQVATSISKSCNEITVKSSNREVCCKYDYVWGPSCTQAEVYDQVKSSVDDVLKGFNSTIFAYGQTSSGKTHTMFGKESHIFDDPGIVPRCVRDIFKHSIGIDMSIFVSFIQIYNEQVYDMLDDPERRKPLSIHESSHLSISIAGLTEYQVHSLKQCMSLVELGLRNRTIRETHMNNASSRSHSILQISIEQRKFNMPEDSHSLMCSKLNLVDLAGSERWDSSGKGKGMANDQISELTNINSSLHTLGRCISALARRPGTNKLSTSNTSCKPYHIPFRDSKLTRILQDSIGGKSKTILVANINPSLRCADESISTLRFADRTHQVMTFAQVNQVMRYSESAEVRMLRGEILRLRKILEMNGIKHNNIINTDKNILDKKSLQSQDTGIIDDLIPIAENEPLHVEGAIATSTSKSISKFQQLICKKIIHALSSVLLSVDIFLKTINNIPNTKNDDQQQKIMSNISLFDKINGSCAVDDNSTANKKRTKIEISPCVGSVETTDRAYNHDSWNKNNITSNIMHNRSNSRNIKSSLSSLLKQRRKLCSDIDENKVDVKLREELNEAKRQRDQKLQLRQRLLEREEKAENPLLSFTLEN